MNYYWCDMSKMCSISSMSEVYFLKILQTLLAAEHMNDNNVGCIMKRL